MIAGLESKFVPRYRIALAINRIYGARKAIEYAWGEEFTEEDWEWAEQFSKQFIKEEK